MAYRVNGIDMVLKVEVVSMLNKVEKDEPIKPSQIEFLIRENLITRDVDGLFNFLIDSDELIEAT